MIVVGEVLISDELLRARFACDLPACRGACCVMGDQGAPLRPEEREAVEAAARELAPALRPEARAVIAAQGPWEEVAPGRYATTCVDGAECVFVVYEGGVARCAIERAGRDKPVSCALFPIRERDLGEAVALNFQPMRACIPAGARGVAEGVAVLDFLREPLRRRFGEDFVNELDKVRRSPGSPPRR